MKLLNEKTLKFLRAQRKRIGLVENHRQRIITVTIYGEEGQEWNGLSLGGGDTFENVEIAFKQALNRSNGSRY